MKNKIDISFCIHEKNFIYITQDNKELEIEVSSNHQTKIFIKDINVYKFVLVICNIGDWNVLILQIFCDFRLFLPNILPPTTWHIFQIWQFFEKKNQLKASSQIHTIFFKTHPHVNFNNPTKIFSFSDKQIVGFNSTISIF